MHRYWSISISVRYKNTYIDMEINIKRKNTKWLNGGDASKRKTSSRSKVGELALDMPQGVPDFRLQQLFPSTWTSYHKKRLTCNLLVVTENWGAWISEFSVCSQQVILLCFVVNLFVYMLLFRSAWNDSVMFPATKETIIVWCLSYTSI